MGVGIDALNCLGTAVNQSSLNIVVGFFVLLHSVTAEELDSFLEKAKNDKELVERIELIIKNGG